MARSHDKMVNTLYVVMARGLCVSCLAKGLSGEKERKFNQDPFFQEAETEITHTLVHFDGDGWGLVKSTSDL